jgi:hypothetical protein
MPGIEQLVLSGGWPGAGLAGPGAINDIDSSLTKALAPDKDPEHSVRSQRIALNVGTWGQLNFLAKRVESTKHFVGILSLDKWKTDRRYRTRPT